MSHDLPDYQSWDGSSFTNSYEQFINDENASWKCCACKFCNSIVSRLDCCKTDMCAVVGHLVAVSNLRCNRWVQHVITWISRHHSTQGKVESVEALQNWHVLWKKQLLCPHSTTQFGKQCSPLCLVLQVFGITTQSEHVGQQSV